METIVGALLKVPSLAAINSVASRILEAKPGATSKIGSVV
jgi:hypothetical protein